MQVEYVQREGYPIETHYITTRDGYILENHRISRGKYGTYNGRAVLLAHGFGSSSAQWVLSGPKRGLGKIKQI